MLRRIKNLTSSKLQPELQKLTSEVHELANEMRNLQRFARRGSIWIDQELLERNRGWGACNTGVNAPRICVLGGIGCNIDHVTIRLNADGIA